LTGVPVPVALAATAVELWGTEYGAGPLLVTVTVHVSLLDVQELVGFGLAVMDSVSGQTVVPMTMVSVTTAAAVLDSTGQSVTVDGQA